MCRPSGNACSESSPRLPGVPGTLRPVARRPLPHARMSAAGPSGLPDSREGRLSAGPSESSRRLPRHEHVPSGQSSDVLRRRTRRLPAHPHPHPVPRRPGQHPRDPDPLGSRRAGPGLRRVHRPRRVAPAGAALHPGAGELPDVLRVRVAAHGGPARLGVAPRGRPENLVSAVSDGDHVGRLCWMGCHHRDPCRRHVHRSPGAEPDPGRWNGVRGRIPSPRRPQVTSSSYG